MPRANGVGVCMHMFMTSKPTMSCLPQSALSKQQGERDHENNEQKM